jgi:hypothetical protein
MEGPNNPEPHETAFFNEALVGLFAYLAEREVR